MYDLSSTNRNLSRTAGLKPSHNKCHKHAYSLKKRIENLFSKTYPIMKNVRGMEPIPV